MRNLHFVLLSLVAMACPSFSISAATPAGPAEYHVSPEGDDGNPGSSDRPFRTVSAAARLAKPGDTIMVHSGTYREWINPPRGGESASNRIIYCAAPGAKPVIKGSEVVPGWKAVGGGVWKVTLPESFFGDYNPYRDLIAGDWFDAKGLRHHTGEVYLDGAALSEAATLDELTSTVKANHRGQWFCEADETSTTIWADFRMADPAEGTVEINVRPYCFYPDKPGRNYLTVHGFQMAHAATQWAPPTAEQPGLIGTHWSKGWIIQDNEISDSKCVGLTLGKDRASGHDPAESAEGYTAVVHRALENGWSREKVGSHIVRNNIIYNCGAAGICGSMGAAFSEISGNRIFSIHRDQRFSGAEQAGIKFHGAIDTVIRGNHISDCNLGVWLDWMTQGTRFSGNLLHSNDLDIFLEVNHGPFLVDNNLFLSNVSMHECSHGGAFVHNLFLGSTKGWPDQRSTPYHKPHSTEIAGFSTLAGGDHRFFSNIFASGPGLQQYNTSGHPTVAEANVYLGGAKPLRGEKNPVVISDANARVTLRRQGDSVFMDAHLGDLATTTARPLATTTLLGNARVPGLPFVNPDGTPLAAETDYFEKKRNLQNPSPGPVEGISAVEASFNLDQPEVPRLPLGLQGRRAPDPPRGQQIPDRL